jgi:L-malate glycosyltransferase
LKVRVLIVGPSLDILGGQAVQAQRLLNGLANSPHVEVAFLAVNPRLPGPLHYLQLIKYVRTVVTSISYAISLLLRVPRVDVIHAFSASYYSFLLAPLPALVAARLFGRRCILNYRSGEASDHLANWPLSRRLIARVPNLVVVPSGYLVRVFADFGIKAAAIPNFVPLESLPYRSRTNFRPVFLSNRNLEALYNVACTLRAFRRVQDEFPEARLIVAGDGSQRSSLEALCATLKLQGISFVGKVTTEKMGALYEQCDIYLNSPNIDNMPSSILEAFACGLPVVTTDAGGIPFIVEHGCNGLMVAVNDSDAMARSILRLLGDQALAIRLATAARAECEQRYVWSKVQAAWENCYLKLSA